MRANLNDIVDRAEDPEKMVKQVLLDLHTQYIQVKTQLAVAITEHHLIDQKAQETGARADAGARALRLGAPRLRFPRSRHPPMVNAAARIT